MLLVDYLHLLLVDCGIDLAVYICISVSTMEWQYSPHISQDQMLVSGAQDL